MILYLSDGSYVRLCTILVYGSGYVCSYYLSLNGDVEWICMILLGGLFITSESAHPSSGLQGYNPG